MKKDRGVDDMRALLSAFAEEGDRHAFSLKDGTKHEGYVLEVDEKSLAFAGGGPLAQETLLKISLVDIEPESLYFYCPEKKRYQKFVLD